jgi:hypothetical protein
MSASSSSLVPYERGQPSRKTRRELRQASEHGSVVRARIAAGEDNTAFKWDQRTANVQQVIERAAMRHAMFVQANDQRAREDDGLRNDLRDFELMGKMAVAKIVSNLVGEP